MQRHAPIVNFFLYKKAFFMYEVQFKKIDRIQGDENGHKSRKNSAYETGKSAIFSIFTYSENE
jgi:hypothetical protein